MSTSWRNKYFERVDCQGVAVNEGTGDILVQGEINSDMPDPIIIFGPIHQLIIKVIVEVLYHIMILYKDF